MGRGCYGAVYEVRLHGLPCIAKRLHNILVGRGREERVSSEQKRAVVERFREESILLSGLRHPNVVQFMGVRYGRDEADISLIMECMHMDLDQCMKTYPDIPSLTRPASSEMLPMAWPTSTPSPSYIVTSMLAVCCSLSLSEQRLLTSG